MGKFQKARPRAHATKALADPGNCYRLYHQSTMGFNQNLERAISAPRMSTYRRVAANDDHAWALYRWNVELGAAVGPLVADLEVALRNAIHEQLCVRFGREDWWASKDLILDDITAKMLAEVVQKHHKDIVAGKVGPSKVVANATLGVWVHLLGRGGHSALGRTIDYETRLWRPALRFAFSTGTFTKSGRERRPVRAQVHSRAALFQRLRNRIAHHEPIWNGIRHPVTNDWVDLVDVWEKVVELLDWISIDLSQWHRNNNLLIKVYNLRPPLCKLNLRYLQRNQRLIHSLCYGQE